MKNYLGLILLFVSFTSYCQSPTLSVSPNVDMSDKRTKDIIETLNAFLKIKDTASMDQLSFYWEKDDFENYGNPFFYLKDVEKNSFGEMVYEPTVMEVLPINDQKNIIKISYISTSTPKPFVKLIYNIVSCADNGQIKFSSYLNEIEAKWDKIQADEATFIVSPNRSGVVRDNIDKQRRFTKYLSDYFKVEKIPYKYFSTSNVEEFFNIQGVQYHPMMYADSTGGVLFDKTVLSANDSEYYPHEIAHLYIKNRLPLINLYFNEGLATYLGGSGRLSYLDLIERLKENPNFDFYKIFNGHVFDKTYWEEDLPITYLVAAILCDYGIETKGKMGFFKIINQDSDPSEIIAALGIDKTEFNTFILEFIDTLGSEKLSD